MVSTEHAAGSAEAVNHHSLSSVNAVVQHLKDVGSRLRGREWKHNVSVPKSVESALMAEPAFRSALNGTAPEPAARVLHGSSDSHREWRAAVPAGQ